MARLFPSLSVSGLVVLLAACGGADGEALFSTSTPPTAVATGAGGDGTSRGAGGSDDSEGGQGGDDSASYGGESGSSGEGAGGDASGSEGGSDAGVFGGNGSDPGAGGGDSGGQSAGGEAGVGGQDPQGGGGQPPGPQGGGGKPQGGAPGAGGSGQAGKAGSTGTTQGDGVRCMMTSGDAVGVCQGGGKGCCLDSGGPNPCVSSDQCQVSTGSSTFGFLSCDGPEDCPGGQCCIGKQNYEAQCRTSCAETENVMCHPGVGALLGCTLAGKSCQKINESNFDTGGIYYECR